jgi:hypothetical protein
VLSAQTALAGQEPAPPTATAENETSQDEPAQAPQEEPASPPTAPQDQLSIYGGVAATRSWLGRWSERAVETSAGVQARYDDITNGLFRSVEVEVKGVEVKDTVRRDDIGLLTGGPWLETTVHWSDRVRTRFGLRAEAYTADVESDLAINSGSADDILLSPKVSLVLGPFQGTGPLQATEIYLAAGSGFHSNDARGATIRVDPTTGEPADRVQPLVRAHAVDVGVRTSPLAGWNTSLTLFALELDSELVFVGDGGATEAGGESRRVGFDLDVTWTDAELIEEPSGQREIPGAIEQTIATGLSFEDLAGFSGALRWRYFAGIPLIEDGSVEWGSTSLVSGRVTYRFANGLELGLEAFNLFDSTDSDIEYFHPSRLPGEPEGGSRTSTSIRSSRGVFAWSPPGGSEASSRPCPCGEPEVMNVVAVLWPSRGSRSNRRDRQHATFGTARRLGITKVPYLSHW